MRNRRAGRGYAEDPVESTAKVISEFRCGIETTGERAGRTAADPRPAKHRETPGIAAIGRSRVELWIAGPDRRQEPCPGRGLAERWRSTRHSSWVLRESARPPRPGAPEICRECQPQGSGYNNLLYRNIRRHSSRSRPRHPGVGPIRWRRPCRSPGPLRPAARALREEGIDRTLVFLSGSIHLTSAVVATLPISTWEESLRPGRCSLWR